MRKRVEEKILSELKDIRKEEQAIKERERELLDRVEFDIHKSELGRKKMFHEIAHFRYSDFSQMIIGCSVFSLPAFINTSFWEYIPLIETNLLIYIHLFLMICVMLAINFEFRDNINTDFWFARMLVKRFFYTYVTVGMVVGLLMILVGKAHYSFVTLDVIRNFLSAQSVGLFGAVTFTFLKK